MNKQEVGSAAIQAAIVLLTSFMALITAENATLTLGSVGSVVIGAVLVFLKDIQSKRSDPAHKASA